MVKEEYQQSIDFYWLSNFGNLKEMCENTIELWKKCIAMEHFETLVGALFEPVPKTGLVVSEVQVKGENFSDHMASETGL